MDPLEIEQKLIAIEKNVKLLAYLKPTNLSLERLLFLTGKRRNPIFRYCSLRYSPASLRGYLKLLKPDSSPLGLLMAKKIQELEKKLDLLQARGTEYFSECSIKLFGAPSKKLEMDAKNILATRARNFNGGKKMQAAQVKRVLEKILQDYGLPHWHVHLKEHLVSDISAGKRHALFLRQDITFTPQRLERIVAHEIETHILTAENGKYQPSKLFQIGFANYLETQEGMAIYAQECRKGCLPLAARRVSYLTLSVCYSLHDSFRNVFEKLQSHGLTEASAFRMALRAKRGLGDTGEPGAFTKDILYLKGYRRIESFIQDEGELKKLYVGKVALEDLPFIHSIGGITQPRYLPKWLGP